MASKKVTLDNLKDAIDKILTDYEDNVSENLSEITQRIAKTGAQAIRNDANAMFDNVNLPRGRYGSGWTATRTQNARLKTVMTIHNKKYPGLSHLLENGHLLRNGRRARAFPHIKPVEEQIVKDYKTEVITKL